VARIQTIEFALGVSSPTSPLSLSTTHPFWLQIFHINDLHGHLMRFRSQQEDLIWPRLAGKIKAARQKCQTISNQAVLFFSAGDDCTGSVFDEILTDRQQDHPIHPGYHFYSKMGVDAAGLGNHDLDHGAQFLAESIKHNAQFPVLAANLTKCSPLAGICHPAALFIVGGLRIGLIGLVTRAETHLDPEICQLVHPVPVAQNLVSVFRPFCDVLIILSHLGYSMGSPVPMADVGDVELASNLPPGSVDLIIGGHSHTPLNLDGLEPENIINGIPIVQAGALGEFLGKVDLHVDQDGVKVSNTRLLPTANMPSDTLFEMEMEPFAHKVRQIWFQPVGVVEDFRELNTEVVQTDFSQREMALANFVTDALVARMRLRGFKVDFAMIDASALQCGFPFRSQLTYGDCFEVMPFVDTLRLYTLNGSQVKDLLDDNAVRFDRVNDPVLERGFLQFSQAVQYTLDPSSTSAQDIRVYDTPLVELVDNIFTIVTTSFIRQLAEPWVAQQHMNLREQLFDLNQYPFSDTDFLLRNEIVAYIKENGGVTRQNGARCDGRLKIIRRNSNL
jgi:2',3'-cyclic-nucleotide 2'-phosphodiesterase (5'-nucleotidase family)